MAATLMRALQAHGITIGQVWAVLGVVVIVAASAYYLGKFTNPHSGAYLGDTEDMTRGGCLLIVLGGGALIFIAAAVWAFRYLFGF